MEENQEKSDDSADYYGSIKEKEPKGAFSLFACAVCVGVLQCCYGTIVYRVA